MVLSNTPRCKDDVFLAVEDTQSMSAFVPSETFCLFVKYNVDMSPVVEGILATELYGVVALTEEVKGVKTFRLVDCTSVSIVVVTYEVSAINNFVSGTVDNNGVDESVELVTDVSIKVKFAFVVTNVSPG